MGNSCGAKERKYEQNDIQKLITVQSIWRKRKAQKKKEALKKQKMKALFSKSHIQTNTNLGNDKKNHREAATLMITQRIGVMNLDELKMNDNEPRIFYDKFIEYDDGRAYKGEL